MIVAADPAEGDLAAELGVSRSTVRPGADDLTSAWTGGRQDARRGGVGDP